MSKIEQYRHTQVGWVTIGALLVPAVLIGPVAMRAGAGLFSLIVFGVVAAVALCFGWMTVTVTEKWTEARVGIGLIRKRVLLNPRIRRKLGTESNLAGQRLERGRKSGPDYPFPIFG